MRPLVFPAPHAIGQALYVGGAQSEVSGVAGEDDSSAVLVVRAVDDPPAPVLQREGADAGTHHHCRGRRRGNNTVTNQPFNLFKCLLLDIGEYTRKLQINGSFQMGYVRRHQCQYDEEYLYKRYNG